MTFSTYALDVEGAIDAHPDLELETYRVRPKPTPAALAAVEAAAGVALPPSLTALYATADGFTISWSASTDECGHAQGSVDVLRLAESFAPETLAALPSPWEPAGHPDEADLDAYRPIDWFDPDGSQTVGVVIGRDGALEPEVFYYSRDVAAPVGLGLSPEEYFEFVRDTLGLIGGRRALALGPAAEVEAQVARLFPDVDLGAWRARAGQR